MWINGIPGDWTRARLYDYLHTFGDIVGMHVRMSETDEGKYEGIGFVQFREPEELNECLRNLPKSGEGNPTGRGTDKDGVWNKPIKLEVARSSKELDIQGIEVDWNVARRGAREGDIGNISTANPRADTHADRGIREEVMDHTFDRLWGISP